MEAQRRPGHGVAPDRRQPGQHGAREQQPEGGTGDPTHCRQHRGLGEEQAAHARAAQTERGEEPQLLRALLDAEQEQLRGQQHGGRDQEEREAEEQPAEVRRRLARDARRRAHVAEVQAECGGIELAAQQRAHVRLVPRRAAHRGQGAEAARPQPAPGGQRHEALGRAAEVVPILLVLVADAIEVDRRAGLPVAAVVGVRQAREVRHQLAPRLDLVGRRAERAHARQVKRAALFDQATRRVDDVVFELDRVALARPEVLDRPVVQQDVVRTRRRQRRQPRVGIRSVGRSAQRPDRGDHRVRDGAVADAQPVDEVREQRGEPVLGLLLEHLDDRRVEEDA